MILFIFSNHFTYCKMSTILYNVLLVIVAVNPDPIPGTLGLEWEYTTPWHHVHTHLHMGHNPPTILAYFWPVGVNQ